MMAADFDATVVEHDRAVALLRNKCFALAKLAARFDMSRRETHGTEG
jgi:hypothetical protein